MITERLKARKQAQYEMFAMQIATVTWIRYNGYASTSYYIKHMSDILIEEMEDNTSYNRFPMNKPTTLNDYRIYFGKERFGQLLAQHFLRGHHKDTIDMTLEYEWLEVTGYEF
jgi:hypothetical protein